MTKDITRILAEQREEAKRKAALVPEPSVEHEGATEEQTGDRTGPGAGYDKEPEQVKDNGGVS